MSTISDSSEITKRTFEEAIDRQFREALGAMKIHEGILNWMMVALKESHRDEKRDHDETIARLQTNTGDFKAPYAMYIDKLDGTVWKIIGRLTKPRRGG